jgi:hypothetical protein
VKLTRRETLTLAALTGAALAGLPSIAFAKEGDVLDVVKLGNVAIPDKVLGDPNAKVLVIEYASPTCPHCAQWSNNVLPAFREKYIDTGKVRFVIRPFARNTLDAAIFMLAEHAAKSFDAGTGPAPTDPSAPSEQPMMAPEPANASGFSQAAVEVYENVLATFFKTQQEWGVSQDRLLGGGVQRGADQPGAGHRDRNHAQPGHRGVRARGYADFLHQRQAVDRRQDAGGAKRRNRPDRRVVSPSSATRLRGCRLCGHLLPRGKGGFRLAGSPAGLNFHKVPWPKAARRFLAAGRFAISFPCP